MGGPEAPKLEQTWESRLRLVEIAESITGLTKYSNYWRVPVPMCAIYGASTAMIVRGGDCACRILEVSMFCFFAASSRLHQASM